MTKRDELRKKISGEATNVLLQALTQLGDVSTGEAARVILHAMIATELEERLHITDDEFDAVFTDDFEGTYAEAILMVLAARNAPATL